MLKTSKENQTYFDVSLYAKTVDRERMVADLGALFGENGDLEEVHRVVPYELIIRQDGTTPQFDVGNGMDRIVMERMYILAKEGAPWMIWISPMGGYGESRFVVARVDEKDKNVKLKCWGISSPKHGGNDCVNLANLIQEKDRFADIETLRWTPVALAPARGESGIDFLEHFIDLPEVWTAIRSGGVEIEHEIRLAAAREVVDDNMSGIFSCKTERDWLALGARMESGMVTRTGVKLQMVGSCGVSNTILLRGLVLESKLFNMIFAKSEVVSDRHFDCPKCQGKIPAGKGIETCPHCGAKKSDYGKVCD